MQNIKQKVFGMALTQTMETWSLYVVKVKQLARALRVAPNCNNPVALAELVPLRYGAWLTTKPTPEGYVKSFLAVREITFTPTTTTTEGTV